MRRTLNVLVLLVLAALLGGSLAASAGTKNHTTCRKLVSGSVSNAELLAYEGCRFDKLDAEVAALQPAETAPEPVPSTPPPSTKPSAPSSPSPSPSVSPSPSPGSSAGSWRDAGVSSGVRLKRVPQDVSSGTGWRSDAQGNVTATSGTAVLSDLLIPGRLELNRATVTNVKVQCIGENDWCMTIGSGSKVTSVEIGGQADGVTYGHAVGLWTGGSDNAGNVLDRVLIHHQISGIRLDGGTTVLNSYIRDLPMGDAVMNFGTGRTSTTDHSGGIMATTNGNVVVRGTRVEGGNTANLFIQHDVTDDQAPAIHHWLIENCEFTNVAKNRQTSSFGVRIENKPRTTGPFTVRNNTFSRGWEVAPILSDAAGTTASGNVYTDGSSIS